MSGHHSVRSHHLIHSAVEIGSLGAERLESSLKVAKAIAASEAFRQYDWLKNVPVKNVSGNFRGMVVSKRWAAVFHFADDVLKPMEKVATLAAIAENIAKSYHHVDLILKSNDSWDGKAARMSTQISSIAIRTVGGVIPAGAHALALSLGGYCEMAGLAGIRGASGLSERLKSLDATINSSFDKITDGENINLFINSHLVIK